MRLISALVLSLLLQPAFALTFYTEENPPLNFQRDGRVQGVSTAVVTEMAKRAGVPADIRLLSWREAYSRTQAEAASCVYSTARLRERNDLFLWVGPLSRSVYSAFALEGFDTKIGRVDDLKKYRIGVVADARATYLRQRGFTTLIEYDADRDIPGNLTLDPAKPGAVDLWVTHAYSARETAKREGAGALRDVFGGILSQDYWLACNKAVPADQVKALSQALQEMNRDGSLDKLLEIPK